MNIEELERAAYVSGDIARAALLNRVADLEHAASVLLNQLDLHGRDLGDEIHDAIDQLREGLRQ